MTEQIEVRLSGMVPACTYMDVGKLFNIRRIEDEMVWCYCRTELFGDHTGMVQLVSPNHIKIMPEGIMVGDKLGISTIHELTCSPKLTHRSEYCFSFSPEPVEFYTAEEAREKFLKLFCTSREQYVLINHMFPVGTHIEENTRLLNMDKFKNPKCPQCGEKVSRVYPDSILRREQLNSFKPGDFYCDKCPSNGRGRIDTCYWWNNELDRGPFAECFKDG